MTIFSPLSQHSVCSALRPNQASPNVINWCVQSQCGDTTSVMK